ncbi:unnamed protein product [Phytophthora lilii]|uniref:Unnamed protein product n=1 Tax=Phytophthora lilii TaxID=2077276 RepID=A0A9W6X2B2_9STRA|nr:unnamed protein product [Phytophthora lilii]
MYIGPWQEYRLAKIQDDAIQRLRQEWEAQLRGQLPPGDDDRIRELMQPLVAKLPSMLLAAKSRTNGAAVSGSRSGVNSEAGSRCSSLPQSARSNVSSASVRTRANCSGSRDSGDVVYGRGNSGNNQDTHDIGSARAATKPPKPKKKGKKAPLTALEQVQKRKKMFATWIKQAGKNNVYAPGQKVETTKLEPAENITKLPPIHSAVPASALMLLGDAKTSSPLTFPPIHQLNMFDEVAPEAQSPNLAPCDTSNSADLDLDDSVDEEAVNNLLNWTDTLLSPQAMDSFCDFDD